MHEGYQWLYRAGKHMHCNVTGRYEELQKEGWSIYPDGRDLKIKVITNTLIPVMESVKRKRGRRRKEAAINE